MTKRTLRIAGTGAVAAVAAALPLAAQAAAKPTTLIGTVGPGFTITLKDAKGANVSSLKAGAYTIKVADLSDIHNFHLAGPGVNKDTGLAMKGSSVWNVTLKKGAYTFVCDPHATIMKGKFTVA
jgi:plastocyanin